MDLGILSLRYARAIYEYAHEKGVEKEVYDDLSRLIANFKNYPVLEQIMQDPTMSAENKVQILQTACGMSVTEATQKAIYLIVENNRNTYIQSIARMYLEVYRKDKGIQYATLTTSESISEETKKEFEKLVMQYVKCECVEFHTKVEPDIIGGFILQIDDQRLNASVKNQLTLMKQDLME
ncbi:F0F1 ATP synthase subunit delta [Paludibacteraceae bacterium OttesenSCG-928-F17]|nr:F0F1 ATP synthase subunit delta [Paludibacteraceae bacterium OttesenSCG-928-F17]